jgi:hypothetical protein
MAVFFGHNKIIAHNHRASSIKVIADIIKNTDQQQRETTDI